MYKISCYVVLFALNFSHNAFATAFNTTQLMDILAKHPPRIVKFTEKKYLSIVEQTLESTGELRFTPPDRLEKHTLTPRIEIMILAGDSLSITRDHHTNVLQLQDYPEAVGMVASIRALLAGDYRVLARVYRLTLQGDTDNWVLGLIPIRYQIGTLVAHIEMAGSKEVVHTVEIMQADGDRAVLYLQAIQY